ncbi:hypothetical protein HJC23_010641 [Cyclotella cryptica]|uniref:Helicase-associated domain-containing protein n=1 Tax=Cyclotella cryptica TaxID=29204 RepID=A0ABD3PH52_9STRA
MRSMTSSSHKRSFLPALSLLFTSSAAFQAILPPTPLATTRPTTLIFLSSSPSNDVNEPSILPTVVTSPVLTAVYPALLAHISTHGHPNIPLGSADGKRCKTLRRLAFQNKITTDEMTHLTELGFRFHSLEDVYHECDFDEMMVKLRTYHEEFGTFQIPKKYEEDPELGAWVTMVRRLYRTGELPLDQVEKMEEIQFEWVSTRKCGSSFMSRYREVLERLNGAVEDGLEVEDVLSEEEELRKWIYAQKCAYENGKLSDSRIQYMNDLPGIDWRNISV